MQMVLNTAGSVFYLGCQWLMTVLAVRISGYGAAGELTLASSITNLFSVIALFTMRQFQISDLENKYGDKEYISSRYLTCLAAFGLCLVYVLLFCEGSRQRFCVAAFMVIKVTEALADVFHGILQKQVKYHVICISYLLRGTVLLVTFILLLAETGNTALTLSVISAELAVICFAYDRRKINTGRIHTSDIDRKGLAGLLCVCLPLVIYNFIIIYIPVFPRLVYAGLYGTEQLGVFGSLSAPTMLINVVAILVFNPLVPFFCGYYKNRDMLHFRELFLKVAGVLVLSGAAAVLAVKLAGSAFLVFLFGEGIIPYTGLFVPVALSAVLIAAVWVFSNILIAIRKIKTLLFSSICTVLPELFFLRKMIILWGMDGISYSIIIFSGMLSAALFMEILFYIKKRGKENDGLEPVEIAKG